MTTEETKDKLRDAGITAWRATMLATVTVLVLILYLGMAVLVYQGQMGDGPLVLFTGVILGYLLRAVRGLV